MASRFFAGGSSTESDSESSDDGILVPQKQAPLTRFFLSDDEEETKRVVRSAKSKRHDEISEFIKQIKNQKKIRDVSRVLTSFEEMMKVYTKAQNVLNTDDGQCPRFYIRCLVELEEFVNELWEDKKKLNKANAKSLSSLRQKLRKYMKELDAQITKYKDNPDAEDKEEEEREVEKKDEESDSEEDEPKSAPVMKKVAPPKVKQEGDYDDESDDSWDASMSEDSTSDDDVPGMTTLTAEYFLKKTTTGDDKASKKKERRKDRVRPKDEEALEEEEENEDGEGKWEKVKGGIKLEKEKPKMFAKDVEITPTVVLKKLGEIVGARGKRATNRADQIELLKELRNIASQHNLGLGVDLKVAFHVMSAVFDYNPNVATCMKPAIWEMCLALMQEMLDILMANPDVFVSENLNEDAESLSEPPYKVRGCILTVAERLDEEFTKMLQATDAHSTEYVERLKDETIVTGLIVQLQSHLENTSTSSEICRVYLRNIQHIYYKYDYEKLRELEKSRAKTEEESQEKTDESKEKTDEIQEKTEGEGQEKTDESQEKTKGESQEKTDESEGEKKKEEEKPTEEVKLEEGEEEKEKGKGEEDSLTLMDRMCKYIYSKDTTDLIRTRTMLCHIYHYAIHDRWYTARDLMLMSHLQQTIQFSDIPTQILYNRTMVQLGLCAFRHGNIRDAHNALLDIQSGGRAKELLAQGLLMRQQERDAQQEKIEKSRQLPFHMHINLELLECVYLVSAMLLEIPYMASHHFDIRRRMISKSFHHQLRLSERQTLIGPPESMREHVVAASRAMRYGDWRGCKKFLINEKMNMKVWNLFKDSDHVRKLITRKIQEESLRTYLFTYGSVYDALSLITLSDMFELEKTAVHSIVSKMIINEELMASWDEPAATIVMHRCEPTRLQHLSLRLADKVSNLVENNERLIDARMGDNRFKGRDFNKDGNRREGGYKDGGRGGYRGGGRDNRYHGDNQGGNRYRDGGGRRGGYNRDGGGGRRGGYNRDGGGRDNYNRDGQSGGYRGGYRGGYNRGGGYQDRGGRGRNRDQGRNY
ncbi:eukaryotic translation initiation factor 3 subunit C [Strongylocentrotus purpuratus]|uniref:Eukaryotic translation initiation factor 3 subunit C n=1 Tax=Strongylocentrotus purpuratus TaxID=7668 RepID=A0A7M7P8F1_STRPU|nr:eukaryotic translation initiation factor 3 subunit C [Strongylocentrotus purpuratus]